MKTIAKINLDLQRPNFATEVDAMQDDGETRALEVSLTSGGTPWNVPEGAAPMVVFRRPNYTKGMYDQLADGSPAISVDGNTVTVVLSRQMLAVPGQVRASLQFEDAQLNMLTTFPFKINVQANPYGGAQSVQDVVRLQWLEDELGKWLKKAAESGEFDGPPGPAGKTPEKGVDYFTPSEKQQFEDAVYDRSVEKMNPVLESARAATQAAGTAAKNADVKAKEAETAAQGAATAAAGANQAAAEASKQSSAAGEAANGANHASGLANAAANGAEQAAKRADTAAQGAGQATQEATTAAASATKAAGEASASAKTANDAAAAIPGKIAGKLDKPAAQPAAGQILKVQKINPDGTFVVGWADDGGGTVQDVQINGATIVQDGVANVQLSNGLTHGTALGIAAPTQEQIAGRNPAVAITGATLDSGVKVAMCDGKGPAWTAQEQAAARDRMGLSGVNLVIDETLMKTDRIEFSKALGTDWKEAFVLVYAMANESTRSMTAFYPANAGAFYDFYPGAGKNVEIRIYMRRIAADYLYYTISYTTSVSGKTGTFHGSMAKITGVNPNYYITRTSFEDGTTLKVWVKA